MFWLNRKEKEELEALRDFKNQVALAVGCNEEEHLGRILNGIYLLIGSERILKELFEKERLK